MSTYRQALGHRGETLARRHLEANGYTILEANYRTREGEIDLVAEQDEAVVFVEVRTLAATGLGTPAESITPSKQAHLVAAAQNTSRSTTHSTGTGASTWSRYSSHAAASHASSSSKTPSSYSQRTTPEGGTVLRGKIYPPIVSCHSEPRRVGAKNLRPLMAGDGSTTIMIPFIASQIHTLVESIRLLETFVTAPLGLYADIRMLRESLSIPEAVDLTQSEQQERRISFRGLVENGPDLALETIGQINTTLDILEAFKDRGDAPLDDEWVSRARRVLDRAQERVAGDLRAQVTAKLTGLYVIVDPEATRGRPVAQVAEAALKGGARVLQLRYKTGDRGDVLPVARELRALCESRDALFVMNDDPALAVAVDAHGLHLGQSDMPVEVARRMLSHHQFIGTSNNTMDQALHSQQLGADYLAVGAVFPTTTVGKGARNAVGPGMVSKVKERVSQPVVAIGGINSHNVAEVVAAGADSVCVVSAVTHADDPEAAARGLVEAIARASTQA